MQKLNEVAATRIKARINGDRNHGWGKDDSMEVIEDLIHADVENAVEAKTDMAKYTLSPEARREIERVVNPSAFRLYLESDKVGALNKGKPRGEKIKDTLAELLK